MHVVCSAANKSGSNFADTATLLNDKKATIQRTELGFSNYKKKVAMN